MLSQRRDDRITKMMLPGPLAVPTSYPIGQVPHALRPCEGGCHHRNNVGRGFCKHPLTWATDRRKIMMIRYLYLLWALKAKIMCHMNWKTLRGFLIIWPIVMAHPFFAAKPPSLPNVSSASSAALGIIQKSPQDDLSLSLSETIDSCSQLLASHQKLNRSFTNELLLQRARAYLRSGKIDEARKDLVVLLKNRPNDPEVESSLAYTISLSGSDRLAAQILEKILDKKPNCFLAYNYKAILLLKGRKYQESISVMAKGLSISPSVDGYLTRAQGYIETADPDKALLDLNECIRRWPYSAGCKTYYLKAQLLRNLGRFEESLECLLIAEKLGLDKEIALYEAWLLYYWRQSYDLSLVLARRLIDLSPRSEEPLVAAAASCNGIGEYNNAYSFSRSALKLNPKNHGALTELAWAFFGLSDYFSAIDAFNSALRLAPSDPNALCGKAILLASCPSKDIRDGVAACKLAEKACEKTNWSKPYCIAALAVAKAELGHYEEARSMLQRALKLPPLSSNNTRRFLYEDLISSFGERIPPSLINALLPLRLFVER